MDSLVNNTLSAWLLVESLNPGEVKYDDDSTMQKSNFLNGEKQKRLQSFASYYDIWNDERFKIAEEDKKNGKRIFRLYRNCFMFKEIDKEIRNIFDDDKEIFNLNKDKCYGYTFQTDESGKVISGSLHTPMIMSALKEIRKNKSANIEESFNDSKDKFAKKFNEIIADEPIDEKKLIRLDEAYQDYFAVLVSENAGMHRHYFVIEHIKNSDTPEPDFNSFFITDIERARKDPNETLKAYIEGVDDSERTEVHENKAIFDEFLNPEYLPDGRWPSKIEHKLSLMQQLAVNSITNSKEYISSVNGPPGTGKTTLLKDIFAHLVVERAKAFTKLDVPWHAFESVKIHETDSKSIKVLKEEFTKFKMVVTSSNNGAVENISKDLPKLKEVVRKPEKTDNPQYEANYKNAVDELKSFGMVASNLIGEPAWGLFSGVFGKSKNINNVMQQILNSDSESDNKQKPFVKLLQDENKDINSRQLAAKWKECKKEFNEELKKVKELKQLSIEAYRKYKENEQLLMEEKDLKVDIEKLNERLKESNEVLSNKNTELEDAAKELQYRKEQIETINEMIQTSNQKGLFEKMISMFNANEDDSQNKYKEEKIKLLEEQKAYHTKSNKLQNNIKNLENDIKRYEEKIKLNEEKIKDYNVKLAEFNKYKEKSDVTFPDSNFWDENNYGKRQVENLWNSKELHYRRGLLFLKAMKLQKLLLVANNGPVYYAMQDFKNRNAYLDSAPERVKNAWNVMHLIFPVVSTTFASFANMYRGLPKDFIDYLFIDEAGQAIPQAAVGALYRSKKVVAVGDPIQIEPVVTMESNLIDNIRKGYNIHEHLLSKESSVQSVADLANKYGYWKPEVGNDEENKNWIGIPLWVHRRCLNPMFTIANQIAYNNKMVLPENKDRGKTGWYDIKGNASQRQFVKEQGDKVIELLINDWRQAKEKGEYEPSVFVISPFTEVQRQIKNSARNRLVNSIDDERKKIIKWIDKSIGTVHTFQGKEAKKVYFVIGTDSNQGGAVNWSCEKPNLLNVAVTRAKNEFYVIGDKERIKSKPYYSNIDAEANIYNLK